MKRNPKSPWNPAEIVEVTATQYEKQVIDWLNSKRTKVKSYEVKHLGKIAGAGGEYEIDGYAEIEVFNGAIIKLLIECKRYTRPVEREVILALYAKLQDVGANKAIIFSTSGFQKGAIEYATTKGIATVTFLNGTCLYESRSLHDHIEPPSYLKFPEFAGVLNYYKGSIHCSSITQDRNDALINMLLND